MINHDSPEAILARATQQDPIIMYLIVKESLGMSAGKIAAQCAHASQMMLLKYMEFERYEHSTKLPPFSREVYDSITEWLDNSFRKVVLRASDSEWNKIKEQYPEKRRITVVDAGLTEVDPGTETVIGLFPMRKSVVPKVIKRLQVLK
jgi:PTH2 family peptidyl-tRNA hydrolase